MRLPIAVLGAGGLLGHDITTHFSSVLGEKNVFPLYHKDLDVTDPTAIRSTFEKLKPAVVVNCVGYTQVDQAETDQKKAFLLNGLAPKYLAEICTERKVKLIHFGSDQVFSGFEETPRSEQDTPCPANFYAATKLYGELSALNSPAAIVMRVQWLYGEKKDRFAALKTNASYGAITDQWGAPTWTLDIAKTVLGLMEKNHSGLFHFAYDDWANWQEIFRFIKESKNLDITLNPVSTQELSLKANRPSFSVLSNRKLCEALGLSGLGSWKESLGRFLSLESAP